MPVREAIESRFHVPAISVAGADDWLGEWTFALPQGSMTDEPVVSIDFNGDAHSATIDLASTMVLGDLAKVVAWYDNETGYATRLFELAVFVGKKGV